jgi:hypothetical protein
LLFATWLEQKLEELEWLRRREKERKDRAKWTRQEAISLGQEILESSSGSPGNDSLEKQLARPALYRFPQLPRKVRF